MIAETLSTPESPTLVADVLTASIPAVAGLLGVVLGGVMQPITAMWIASTQRRQKLEDEAAERSRADEKVEAERNYERAKLARHLEGYARDCAKAMWANDDQEVDEATSAPKFPKWPSIAWELLGAAETMRARDIEVRVEIQHEKMDGDVWHGASSEDEAKEYLRDGAARIGLDAWKLASSLRIAAGVAPLQFPAQGANFAASLESHVAKLDDQMSQHADFLKSQTE